MLKLNMTPMLVSLILFLNFSSSNAGITSHESDGDGLKTYIVHVQKSKQDNSGMETDLESWYHSFLPSTISSSGDRIHESSRMVHYYRHVISGFAARLTAEEAKAMETKPGFISAHVEGLLQLHTTHSPTFLGLHRYSGFWKDSNFGKGVIIGVLDSGVAPNHPSFSDEGMPPPPAKWKGRCELQGVGCNNKIIGARAILRSNEPVPPTDNEEGHGTHCAGTAAGSFVEGANKLGMANGTAVGIAPLAHLAIYKVCETLRLGGCPEGMVNAAIDAAVEDGVDVISISLGVGYQPFYDNSIACATFSAMRKGVFVSISAGNFGPEPSIIVNDAPWMLTVGASSTDRRVVASARLGNQVEYDGESQHQDFPSKELPLVFPGATNASATFCVVGSLKGIDVRGKVVLCEQGDGNSEDEVKDAGAVAIIFMNNKTLGYTSFAYPHSIPTVRISNAAGESIKAYANSTPSPTAFIEFKGTVIGKNSAPEVAAFSSRGPSRASPGILKPDIIGPGVSILAAVTPYELTTPNTEIKFTFMSGTSMSCPHLSGIAALLKSAHPDWSPAAIKSAIMTTADTKNVQGNPIIDQTGLPADLFAMGAGHVNPLKANDPGLVYDIQPDDYIPYLCGLNYTDLQVQKIVNGDVQCSKVSSIPEAQLNYPSFSIRLGSTPQTYTRTVTNVGNAESSYTSQIVAPEGVEITVRPEKIHFTDKNQKATYSITFVRARKTDASYAQAYLTWVSSNHSVNSPLLLGLNDA